MPDGGGAAGRLVAGILLISLASGCSLFGGNGDGDRGRFTERLGMIPASVADRASDSPVQIAVGDVDRATDLAGVERPTDPGDEDAVRDYLLAFQGMPAPDGSGPTPAVAGLLPEASRWNQPGTAFGEFEDELGWSLLDVSWFVEYQVPPEQFTVMGGDFEEERLEAALGEPADGHWRVGGEDHEADLEEVSAARPIGEALRLAYDDERMLVSRSTAPMDDATGGDDVETLADDPVIHDLAAAFDDEGVYAGTLVAGGSFSLADRAAMSFEALDGIEGDVLPEAFQGLAVGVGHEDDAAFAVFAYAHADESSAAANAEALPGLVEEGYTYGRSRPWSEWFSVDDIRRDETTVVARFDLVDDVPPQTVHQVIYNRDALVVHR